MWIRALLDHPFPAFQWGTVLGVSLVAALTDLRTRRIPNVLSLTLFAAGLVQAMLVRGWGGLFDSLTASVVLALPYLILFAFGGGGAGDAKLMGGIGAWLGIFKGILALFSISLCGVALAFLVSRLRKDDVHVGRWLRGMLRSITFHLWLRRLPSAAEINLPDRSEMKKMAYAPAIGLGVLFACTSWYLWHA